jgi:ribose transport system ATP-binding protein
MGQSDVLLEITGLNKSYPGVQALDNVDFTIRRGETHVLVGENGAGKSTLVGYVTGAFIPDSVEKTVFDGNTVSFHTPKETLDAGIGAVRQHFSLIPTMTVAENIFLNRELTGFAGAIDLKQMRDQAQDLIDNLGVPISPLSTVEDLGPEDQQIVEICKAVAQNPKLLVMDEPTSGLRKKEVERLFGIIERLKTRGVTILYISHRLEEVFTVGDHVSVLRNGKKVADQPLSELDHKELVELIVGRAMGKEFPKESIAHGEIMLKAAHLENDGAKVPIHDVNVELRSGEIVGVYGILGSGKDTLANTIGGATPPTSGSLEIEGEAVTIRTPNDAIRHGIGHITDDRAGNGMLLELSVKQNTTIAALKKFCSFGYIRKTDERRVTDESIEKLKIRTPGREATIKNLSGGNQQKVVVAKWLLTDAKILILHEPTKGIDIGAKTEVFRLMSELARNGAGILFVSSELDELIGMSDRVLVMRNGRIVDELSGERLTEHELLAVGTAQD